MDSATAERLLQLNRSFYTDRGTDFSDTRLRIQPGVRRFMHRLQGNELILDLGCGNGAFARELSARGHRGRYVGIDQSAPQLEHARGQQYGFPVKFLYADLAELARMAPRQSMTGQAETHSGLSLPIGGTEPDIPDETWSVITAFAVLHHIPGRELRLALLRRIRRWIRADGVFVISNWQLTGNSGLRGRIRPWSEFTASIQPDEGDYLVDWRRGGIAYRYVHEFGQDELIALAVSSGFNVLETFRSDGRDRQSGLYQLWRPS